METDGPLSEDAQMLRKTVNEEAHQVTARRARPGRARAGFAERHSQGSASRVRPAESSVAASSEEVVGPLVLTVRLPDGIFEA